jgi:uncharacterized protein YggE
MTRHLLWSAVVGAVVVSAAALPLATAAQQAPEAPPFLMVTGTGEASVPSDRARIDFMVETQAPTAAAAASQNADRMDAVMKALKATGGATVTIETGGYDLSPVYRQPSRTGNDIPTVEAYRAVNHVRVRVDDVARVGALIDAGVGAGGNRIAGLSFEAKDPEPGRVAALKLAVARARAEAETVATAMGATLGAPLEVNVSADYSSPPPMPMYRMVMDQAQASAPTPVSPGEQVVRANVSIRYRLGR